MVTLRLAFGSKNSLCLIQGSSEIENNTDPIQAEEDAGEDDLSQEIDSSLFETEQGTSSHSEGRGTSAASKRRRTEKLSKEDEALAHCIDALKNVENKDKFTIFGEYIASELRSLEGSPDLQHKLKSSIQHLILDISDEQASRSFQVDNEML